MGIAEMLREMSLESTVSHLDPIREVRSALLFQACIATISAGKEAARNRRKHP
jgi:hypothetical protein